MIILFKETPETRKDCPCKSFRWTVKIQKDFVGFVHQHQYNDGEWRESDSLVYGISYHGLWKWKLIHIYYDGPHCGLAVGPFRLQWYNGNCKKCHRGY